MTTPWNPVKCDAVRPKKDDNGLYKGFQCSSDRFLGCDGLCTECFETRRLYIQAHDIEGKRTAKDLQFLGPRRGWHGIFGGLNPPYSCLVPEKQLKAAARNGVKVTV